MPKMGKQELAALDPRTIPAQPQQKDASNVL